MNAKYYSATSDGILFGLYLEMKQVLFIVFVSGIYISTGVAVSFSPNTTRDIYLSISKIQINIIKYIRDVLTDFLN